MLLAAYQRELAAHLDRFRRYPRAARLRRDEGEALVRFAIDRAGHVLSLSLDRQSGSAILDEESLDRIHRAEPLPPMPEGLAAARVEILLPIRFRLDNSDR